MQRKFDKKKVYNAGTGKANEEIIHLHMSNHYRRILNAKKAVDNSPPYCYKIRRQLSCKPFAAKTKTSQQFETLALTDRSLSTNSNKESFCGLDSYSGSSRYHARCIPERPTYEPKTKHSYCEVSLVDRITYDTKNGPAAYCDEGWMEEKSQQNYEYDAAFEVQHNCNEVKVSPSAKHHLPATKSNETAQKRKLAVQKKLKSARSKGAKSFSPIDSKIYNNALKTEAVSKLRSLRVYYPPRRKKTRNKIENSANSQIPLGAQNCKCTKICVCDASETTLKKNSFNPKEQSLTSSRDSAYNGGVSSLPESRSPTPDQRRKKECCCCCCEKKQREGKPVEPSKPTGSRIQSPRPPVHSSAPSIQKSKSHEQESFKKIQEDALYVKFIQDITTEILDKNLYTNKALKKVMKKHIKNNIKRLRKDRMLKEVENLRIQLGIPEDKTLLELEVDPDGVACNTSKFYPIISDSEFVMPKNESNKNGLTGNKTTGKVPKGTSAVMSACRENEEIVSESETDNGDVISVVQVMKSVREKRTEKSGEMPVCQTNSSEDSDRPSDPKKRSVLKNRKQKYMRTYSSSSSSSDSERSEEFSRNIREKTECGVSGSKESFLGDFGQKSSFLNKKNRSVSFWKNPDLNCGRTYEIKHKKTVTKSKESIIQDAARDKHKND